MDKIDPTLMSYLKGPYGAASLPSLNDVNKMQLALPGYGQYRKCAENLLESKYILGTVANKFKIKVEQIRLETTEQLLTLQWQPVISTIFNYNRINYQGWECMDCHHFMEIFMVSVYLENDFFFERKLFLSKIDVFLVFQND